MRHDGHLIKTLPAGTSVIRYVLLHENPSPTPRPPQSPKPVPSKSWDEIVREREEKMRQPEPSFELVP